MAAVNSNLKPEAVEQITAWTAEAEELARKIAAAEAVGDVKTATNLQNNYTTLLKDINRVRSGERLERVLIERDRQKFTKTATTVKAYVADMAKYDTLLFGVKNDPESAAQMAAAAAAEEEANARAAAAALPDVIASLAAARRAESPFMEDEPLFEGFPDKVYSDELLNHIFALSQYQKLTATIQTSKTPDNNGKHNYFEFKGFSPIVLYILLKHLDKSGSVFVTSPITILEGSITYKPGPTVNRLGYERNNSFIGITNFNKFKNAYAAQTERQDALNKSIEYSNSQKKLIKSFKYTREGLYSDLKIKSNTNTENIDVNWLSPYQLQMHSLFSETTRAHFIRVFRAIIGKPNHGIKIIVIPIILTPLYYTMVVSQHAQCLIINLKEKKYTIFDSEYNADKDTRHTTTMEKELEGIEPLISECMGEKYTPYMYSIRCPQSIIKDRNCIWWSLLMSYLYIKAFTKSDRKYTSILARIVEDGSKHPVFLFKLISSFKAFVLESLILPQLLNGSIDSPDLRTFFREHFPALKVVFKPYEKDDSYYKWVYPKHLPKNSIHGLRNIAAVDAAAAERAAIESGKAGYVRLGGRRRKLTSKSRRPTRIHNYGKHTRKSHRR